MATSTFRRELGARFIALGTELYGNTGLNIKAGWTFDNSRTPPAESYGVFANDPGLRLRFIAAAKDGGDALSPNDFVDSLHAWLSALAREAHVTGIARTPIADGFELDNLIQASVNLCAAMESDMLDVERHRRYIDAREMTQIVGSSGPSNSGYDGPSNFPASGYPGDRRSINASEMMQIVGPSGPSNAGYEGLSNSPSSEYPEMRQPPQETGPLPSPQPPIRSESTPATPENRQMYRPPTARRPSTVSNPSAVKRIEAYLDSHPHVNITQFVGRAEITDRTLRTIRKSSSARRSTWQGIAKALGITLEELLRK